MKVHGSKLPTRAGTVKRAAPPADTTIATTLWGEQVGRFERAAPGFQGGVLLREGVCLLAVSCWDCRPSTADLGQGARGRIVEVRLPPGRRFLPESPLQPGADDARRRWEALAGDADRLDAAAFRARYRLP